MYAAQGVLSIIDWKSNAAGARLEFAKPELTNFQQFSVKKYSRSNRRFPVRFSDILEPSNVVSLEID